jgi:hypothetical protein
LGWEAKARNKMETGLSLTRLLALLDTEYGPMGWRGCQRTMAIVSTKFDLLLRVVVKLPCRCKVYWINISVADS